VLKPDKSQPVYMEGYHRAAVTSPEDATYQAIAEVLGTGRTSRLYRSLVRDQKVAVQASVFPAFPGGKYPPLMVFFGIPAPGRTNEEVQAAIRVEIEKIKNEPVTDEELAMVKSRAKASLVRGLQSNMGIARQLGVAQTIYGDWREMFTGVAEIDAVTKEDIQRVAKATFVPDNRTIAMIVNEDAKPAKN
jgi:predicted Zn-dependent peptidase